MPFLSFAQVQERDIPFDFVSAQRSWRLWGWRSYPCHRRLCHEIVALRCAFSPGTPRFTPRLCLAGAKGNSGKRFSANILDAGSWGIALKYPGTYWGSGLNCGSAGEDSTAVATMLGGWPPPLGVRVCRFPTSVWWGKLLYEVHCGYYVNVYFTTLGIVRLYP